MLDLENLAPERIRPIRRSEYDQMVEMGLFEDERVELLAGVLVQMSPQGGGHSGVIMWLNEVLVLALHGRARIGPQLPFALSEESEPEPDLMVLPIDTTYKADHPSKAHLIIEVADSSLRKDRALKGPLYAAAGVPEYWVVNLRDGVVEVHRDPTADGYATVTTAARGDRVSPLAFPDLVIAVADILPG